MFGNWHGMIVGEWFGRIKRLFNTVLHRSIFVLKEWKEYGVRLVQGDIFVKKKPPDGR